MTLLTPEQKIDEILSDALYGKTFRRDIKNWRKIFGPAELEAKQQLLSLLLEAEVRGFKMGADTSQKVMFEALKQPNKEQE